ncbi:hydantoinase B/oxoprolinase family protein [Sciscionella marina]|uniref:hydantoinase B/oxoprolinase family protein n=1 Tax=Sciscionella marina TaxID=508770 RepID=UPI00037BE0EC|nr:hydantoinase B/oxoprolinase family protein [Sciscionella marina]
MTTNEAQAKLIGELAPDEFYRRYNCDRLTATILSNKYHYTVEHMCNGLLNTAFSPILAQMKDFATCIVGPPSMDYPMTAVSNSLVLFLGTMDVAVRNSCEEYGVENVRPGDVLIANDAYRIGNHVNDMCLLRPVFHGETEGPVGFIALRAHMLDDGGIVPAGFSATKKNVYENGLVLAPRLIYQDDKPVKETFDLLFDNARFGDLLFADLSSMHQSLLVGERLLLQAIDRYGLDAYLGAVQYGCDVGAETMRTAITQVPDGDYEGEDYLDADAIDDSEEYKVRATVRIRGSRAEVDLSGSSRQARSSINGSWLEARTAAAVAVKYFLDRKSPFTSGALRDIDIVLPEGTITSALPPDGAIFLYWEASHLAVSAILQALEKAMPSRALGGDYGSTNIHNANGLNPDGTPWVAMANSGGLFGPWGGTAEADGENYMIIYQLNILDTPTESLEAETPAVVLRKEYVADSVGPGVNRGGAAVLRDTLWQTDAEHFAAPLRTKRPSGFGVNGGRAGTCGGTWLWESDAFDVARRQEIPGTSRNVYQNSTPVAGVLDPDTKSLDPDGQYFYFARTPIWRTAPGAIFRYITNGGGGWGNPLERDPERVLRDVRDGYVTIDGAANDFGVVITGDPEQNPEGLELEIKKTEKLRAGMAPD